ncbi:cytochrome P450 [Zopfia rhizophila CBS 207.26]|uniref:Cytochrome P450 n=1 Tax=Zopfia rhizophila CBS 207.26 TaxID=1314779 RepID=A0A6A6EHN0_9PEZI|nr:cytochrome P450 [Zopfia rhizophila CBS 207.26]
MSSSVDGRPLLSRAIKNASISEVATVVFAIVVIRLIVRAIYRAYFSPLSKFPGPKLSGATRIPYLIALYKGSIPKYVGGLHRKYGDVVRIAPDEISFINPKVWKDVYGYGTKDSRMAAGSLPTKHWHRYGNPVNGHPSLLHTRGDQAHAQTRRLFSPAFSDRALKLQEPLFQKYVNLLIHKLKEGIEEDPERKFDMVRMYNFTTFDVMGDLTFGEPLHMLSNAEYDPWVRIIFGSIKFGSRLSIIHFYPILHHAFKTLVPESFAKKRMEHAKFSEERVTKRLESGSDNADIWALVLGGQDKEGGGLSRAQMDSNSSLFMIAGTETTATLLSGMTYLLLKNPNSMKKLVEEIRGAFPSSEDINMETLGQLPYLNACVKEALRLYPPVPVGLPRLTPPDGSTICGEYVPGGCTITVPHLAMYTSEKNFREPFSFIPERWLGDQRFADDNKFALQPFSFGPRDCLGKNMAYHEMRLILAKVLYNFDLELCPESENWTDQEAYTLWEKHPLILNLQPAKSS